MENLTSIKVTEANKEFIRRINAANILAHRGTPDLTVSKSLDKLQQFFRKNHNYWEELAEMEVDKNGIK